MTHTDLCTAMSTATLLTAAKRWKQSSVPWWEKGHTPWGGPSTPRNTLDLDKQGCAATSHHRDRPQGRHAG